MRQRVIYTDFDDTVFKVHPDGYPKIGEPIWNVINSLKKEQADGSVIVLYSLRKEDSLINDALQAMKNVDLYIQYIDKSKPYYDVIYEDRSVHPTAI